MTPQLRQAVQLLQLSTLDLQTAIQEQLDSNPMLEVDEGAQTQTDESGPADSMPDTHSASDADDTDDESLAGEQANIPNELPVDVDWDTLYDGAGNTPHGAPSSNNQDTEYYEIAGALKGRDLQAHLHWQLEMTPMSEVDRFIAEVILDALDEDGYLRGSMEDLLSALPEGTGAKSAEVETILHRIQRFDPAGIAARNPAECLSLQLEALPEDTPYLRHAQTIVAGFLDHLANRDLKTITRRLRIDQAELDGAVALIRSLSPYPGALMNNREPEYVIPDVIVGKKSGQWHIELNPDTSPKLRINHHYATLIQRGDHSRDNHYLRHQLQEARWFIKNLHGRNETLLNVATAIVERQQAFLDQGDEAMAPLVLRDVAEAVRMHESTISRVTTQKYMHTPRGLYEFKYFFSSHVGTSDGGERSATAIRAMIRKLCAEEPPGKPLSDNKIADMIGERGINVARRTVAKYRESMNIPPSNERKRLGKL